MLFHNVMNDYSYKQIWLINFPVMMSVLVEQLINITDAIFLGRVGEVEVGAAGLAGIYYLALYMCGFGFCIGLQVLIARRNGEQQYQLTGRTFFQGLFFLIGLSILLILLSFLLTPRLLRITISSPNVMVAALDYLEWRCWGLLFAFPSLAFRAFFVGVVRTKIMTVNAIAMVSTNLILNYLLIYGNGGFPEMGIKGAAIASTISELVSLLVYIIYFYLRVNRQKYGLFYIFDPSLLRQVWKISVWSMLHSFISVAPWFIFFIAVEHLGEMSLAIANIVRSISTFFSVIVNALAATTGSLVSNLIGANARDRIIPLCYKVLKLGYIIGLPLIALVIIFNQQVVGIYSTNPILIHEAFWPLVVGVTVLIFGLPGFVFLNAVSGTGNTRLAFIFQAVTIVLYLIYLWIVSACFTAPLVVYAAIEHLFVISLLVMSYLYMKQFKKNNCGKSSRIRNTSSF